MPAFVKLKDPAAYVASPWDLSRDDAGRAYWVGLFKRHFDLILAMGIEVAVARGDDAAAATERADECRSEYVAHFDAFAREPGGRGPVTILTLDKWRDGYLRRHGFVDPFVDLKDRENAKMLPLLPAVCRQIDAITDEREQVRGTIEGVFAGNIFDMGSEATAKLFVGQSPDFFATRAKLKPRPWLRDDLDALTARLLARPGYRKAVFFIDNAGSDFLLGALPMMRWLARRGTAIVLAANERPTLNDMTIHDVRNWWPRIIETEPSLRGLPITSVSTGTGEPLIDLADVSAELNDACGDADLVVLEGMGRGVESNLGAEFSCDALNIAMIKDVAVAAHVGGAMYDCVCRFR